MDALIGYTGFVGSNIKNQKKFDYYYNSKNINDITNKSFDTVVCSGVSSIKWFANLNPKKDYNNIHSLIKKLKTISFKKFILISTIAVYDNPADNAYGRNRLYLENYIRNNFKNYLIIRLPGLFGKGLKKMKKALGKKDGGSVEGKRLTRTVPPKKGPNSQGMRGTGIAIRGTSFKGVF